MFPGDGSCLHFSVSCHFILNLLLVRLFFYSCSVLETSDINCNKLGVSIAPQVFLHKILFYSGSTVFFAAQYCFHILCLTATLQLQDNALDALHSK